MNYFTELLESYSKLKNRKLILLEGGAQKDRAGKKPAIQPTENGIKAAASYIDLAIKQNAQATANPQLPKKVSWVGPEGSNRAGEIYVADKDSEKLAGKVVITGLTAGTKPVEIAQANVQSNDPNSPPIKSNSNPALNFRTFALILDPPKEESSEKQEEQPKGEEEEVTQPADISPEPEMAVDPTQPGAAAQQIFSSEIYGSFANTVQNIVDNFVDAGQKFQSVIKKLVDPDKVDLSNPEASLKISSAWFGNIPGSLESQLCQSKVIRSTRTGLTLIQNSDPEVTEQVSKNLSKLFNILDKDIISNSDKTFITRKIKFTNRGELIIFGDDSKTGVLFTDASKRYGRFFEAIEKKHDIQINKIYNTDKIRDASSPRVLRSKFLEELICYFSYSGANKKEVGVLLLQKFSKKVQKLIEGIVEIVDKERSNAEFSVDLDPETLGLRNLLNMSKSKSLDVAFHNLSKLMKAGYKVLKPIRTIPTGSEVKYGRRQDSRMIMDGQTMLNLFKSLGQRKPNAAGFMKRNTLSKIHGLSDEGKAFFKLYKKDFKPKRGEKSYYASISSKFYIDDDVVKLGDGREFAFESFISDRPPSKRKDYELLKKFKESFKRNLGIDFNKDQPAMYEYHKNLRQKYEDKIKNIPENSTVVDKKGKSTKIKPFENFCNSLKDQIKNSSLFEEITGDTEKAEILDLIDNYSNEIKKGKSNEMSIRKMKSKIGSFLKYKQLEKDCNSSDTATKTLARKYLATHMFHVAGSEDDSLIVHQGNIKTNKARLYLHNNCFKVVKDFVENGNESALKILDNGDLSIGYKSDENKSLLFSKSIQKSKYKNANGINEIYSQYSIYVNKGLTDDFSIDASPQEQIIASVDNSGEGDLLLEFIKNQLAVLNEMVSKISKDVKR